MTSASLRWDIFCRVIDNFGDMGVCWRLCTDLAHRGHTVRLWTDDARPLAWMAPEGHPGVQVIDWGAHIPQQHLAHATGDVIIEAFGCECAPEWIAKIPIPERGQPQKTVLINLEYLSAEGYVERCHGLPSPIMSGPGAGLTRWFYYPGFTPSTGGLLREPSLARQQDTFDRNAWRARHGVPHPHDLLVSLFCYEPAALAPWLTQLDAWPGAHLLVTPGRAAAAVQAHTAEHPLSALPVQYLPARTQGQFDEMLWASDLNFVRGEDSLVRALWAGQPFIWHIYPQHDNAHHDKLNAFLDWLQAPPSLRQFHHAWNGMAPTNPLPQLTSDLLAQWRSCMVHARQRLWCQNDLLTQLLGFVTEKS